MVRKLLKVERYKVLSEIRSNLLSTLNSIQQLALAQSKVRARASKSRRPFHEQLRQNFNRSFPNLSEDLCISSLDN